MGMRWAIVLGLVGFAAMSTAGDDATARGAGRGAERWERMRQELKLTEEQLVEIRQVEEQARGPRHEREGRIRALDRELESLMSAAEPDRAAIDEKVRALGEARHQAFAARIEMRLALDKILTPEQRNTMSSRREAWRTSRHGHRSRRWAPLSQHKPENP